MKPRGKSIEKSERNLRHVLEKVETGTKISCCDVHLLCRGSEDLAERVLQRTIPEMATVVLSLAEDVLEIAADANPSLQKEMEIEVNRSGAVMEMVRLSQKGPANWCSAAA